MTNELRIIEKAQSLGFDKCAIVPITQMSGFENKLDERMDKYPETRNRIEKLRIHANPQYRYPWAKSIIICSFWYGKYRIPENLQGRIAKYYLTDGRHNKSSDGYQTSVAFENYLKDEGFQIAFDRDFGITALRWAAQEGGIGIIRKNNFFYTEKGSWQYLEAFLIDQPLQYIHTHSLRPCAKKCDCCIQACPTKSLAEPYSMDRGKCISDLTTWSGWDLTREPLRNTFGDWIYGCDACQDKCPYNHNAWTDEAEFPGLEELSQHLSLIQIVESDYGFLEQQLQPALWYLPVEKSWRYKTNALNAMLNHYKPEYYSVIQKACLDEKEPVRQMAAWVLNQIIG